MWSDGACWFRGGRGNPATPTVGDDYHADEYEAAPLTAPAVGRDDLYAIAYTGGTTGAPKGVMLSQAAFATMTMIEVTEWEFPNDLRFLIATPLSHAAAAIFLPIIMKLTWTFAIALKRWMKPFSKLFEWNMELMFRRGLPGLQPYLDSLEATPQTG